ncbi:MAG: GNAT family N-acetyltransferase [Stellaceae bacterium]
MTIAEVTVRRLVAEDVARYRQIRLDALKHDPDWFGSTFETESSEPPQWFADRLERAAVFGAEDREELLGIAGFFAREGRKEAHKGVLWGMYVRPKARTSGIGRRLVEAVIEHARKNVEVLQLTVVKGNEPARRLYASLGFVEYGVERNSLKWNGRYWDEILMAKPLLPDRETAS